MAEIIAYGSKHSHQFKLSVNEVSTDVSSNTSTVSFQFTIYKASYSWSGYNNITYSVTIDGQTYTGTISSYRAGNETLLMANSKVIGHNSDGSKSINFSFNVTDNSGASYTCGNASASGSMALTTIPRASSINSVSGTNIEGNFVVNYTSYYSGFTNRLRISIRNVAAFENYVYSSGTAFTLSQNTINSIYTRTKNTSNQIDLGFVIETWNGNTKIGESAEIIQRCYIPDCNPTIENESYLDTNNAVISITGDNQKIVKNASTLRIVLTNLKSYKEAKLANCTVTIGNTTKSISLTGIDTSSLSELRIDFGKINVEAGTATATIVLTDTRNMKVTKTLSINVLDYIVLSINAVVKRTQPTTGAVDVSFTGNYFNGNIGNTANTLEIKWYYRETGENNWTQGGTITPTISNNTYSNGQNPISLGSIFDYQKSYEIKLEAKDKLTILEPVYTITEGIPIFDWGKNFLNINGRFYKDNDDELLFKACKVIYDNSEGTDQDITLDESINNFEFIEIEYFAHTNAQGNLYKSTGKISSGTKKVQLDLIRPGPDGSFIQYWSSLIQMSGNSITRIENNATTQTANGFTNPGAQSSVMLKITKVLGYK